MAKKMICPKCGSSEWNKAVSQKGTSYMCKICQYVTEIFSNDRKPNA
jgi:rubredoxin